MHRIVERPHSDRMLAIDEPPLARAIIGTGDYTRQTAGIASEYVQGNLCELALDFAAFCQRNPRPCPLIGLGSPGNRTLPDLGDIDIRTDPPRYCVFKDGILMADRCPHLPVCITHYPGSLLITDKLNISLAAF
jgi:uncharacterized protein YcsI (UPF0317 family)